MSPQINPLLIVPVTPQGDPLLNQDTERRTETSPLRGVPARERFQQEQECRESPESKGRRLRCVKFRNNTCCF